MVSDADRTPGAASRATPETETMMGSEMGLDMEREMDVDLAPRAGSFPTDLAGYRADGSPTSSVMTGPVADDAVAGPAGPATASASA